MKARALVAVLFALLGCQPCAQQKPAPAAPKVISIVGTNDLHGRLAALPIFGGYLRNLRAARADGAVVLVDAGDMFQGTLESNLEEGAAIVQAYNALEYAAVTVGNHEFDYGPIGPASSPTAPADDPRGALIARAREARYPFLATNFLRRGTADPATFPGIGRTTIIDAGGVRVGIIGATTEETLETTLATNVADLAMAPLSVTLQREADRLRTEGASIVIVTVHAGGKCERFDNPSDLASCAPDEEIFAAARALRPGAVDVIVAGHTHKGVAHVVNGVAIIESFAYGQAFGRVDLTFDPGAARVVDVKVHPPMHLCTTGEGPTCVPSTYEGRPVVPDERVAGLIAPFVERARAKREERVGVAVAARFEKDGARETALGNLFADLMRQARPGDVAVVNGGGIRVALEPGDLTYGAFYEVFPFDNRFAFVTVTGRDLREMFERNLVENTSILSVSGVRMRASCGGGGLAVLVTHDDGDPILDVDEFTVITSDFIVTGGDSVLGDAVKRPGAVRMENGPTIRDELVKVLRARGGELRPDDPRTFAEDSPRMAYPGTRPVTCERE